MGVGGGFLCTPWLIHPTSRHLPASPQEEPVGEQEEGHSLPGRGQWPLPRSPHCPTPAFSAPFPFLLSSSIVSSPPFLHLLA